MSDACRKFARDYALRIERGQPTSDEHLATCATCREEIAAQLRIRQSLPAVGSEARPAGDWQAKVWARIASGPASARSRRPRWLVWVGAVATVAAALLLFIRLSPSPLTLAVEVEHASTVVRGDMPHPGDTLKVAARVGRAPHVELRLYRDDRLVLRCAEEAPCARSGSQLHAQLPLAAIGRYRLLLITSSSEPGATSAALDADVAALSRQHVPFLTSETVAVY